MMEKQTKFKQTEIGKIPKNFERKEDLCKAINEFILKESFLLKNDLNERTISHKVAEYLQKHFKDYDVDCEYNKMLGDNNNWQEDYITKRLNLPIENAKTNDNKGKTIFPDIVIHKRGANDDNFLVIEIKKKKNCSSEAKQFDFNKLKAFTTELKYEWGVFLEFGKEKITELTFFKDGKKYESSNQI